MFAVSDRKRGVERTPARLEGNSRPVDAIEDLTLATALKVFDHGNIAAAMQSLPERWRTVL